MTGLAPWSVGTVNDGPAPAGAGEPVWWRDNQRATGVTGWSLPIPGFAGHRVPLRWLPWAGWAVGPRSPTTLGPIALHDARRPAGALAGLVHGAQTGGGAVGRIVHPG